jgi:hypothetical protein
MYSLSRTICCECCNLSLFNTILSTSGLSTLNIFIGFFFNGIAVLAGASTNLCDNSDILGDGDLTRLTFLVAVSDVLDEYTDLSEMEPRVALFDIDEDDKVVALTAISAFGGLACLGVF